MGSAAGAEDNNPNFDLRHELDLAKAALLYADKVELVSAGASLLYGWVALRDVPTEQRMRLVREHAPVNAGFRFTDEQMEKFDLVLGERSRAARRGLNDRERIRAKIQLKGVADQAWRQLTRDVEQTFEAYNARGLREAVDSKLLKLHRFEAHSVEGMLSMAAEGFTVRAAVDEILREYLRQAEAAMEGSGYPLFDDLTGRLVGEAVRDGAIAPSETGIRRGRHGGLSGDLLSRLPLFEKADVSDVLEVRRELRPSLKRFRKAVAGFSKEIRSAAWEPGFANEADLLFRETVEPAVDEIEEQVRSNRSLEEFAVRMVRHGANRATIGAAVGGISDLSVLSGVVMGLGAAAVQTLLDQRAEGKKIEGNQLYFYYGAREMLGHGRR